MASPQANTKIELVIEGIESLTLAVLAAQGTKGDAALRAHESVMNARQECRDALAELLKPTFRVLLPDAREAA